MSRIVIAVCLLLTAALVHADESETEVDLGVVGWWPDLAVGPDGAVHLVYARCGPCRVHYRVWRDGWSAEETVPGSSNVSTDDVNSPRVAVDAAGRVHVVWAEDIRVDNSPWYARRTETGWESAVRVSTDTNEDVEGLDVEVHDDTVFIAANVLDPGVEPPVGPGSETRRYWRTVDGSEAFTGQRLGDQGKDVRLFRGRDDRLYVLYWWIQWRFDRFLGFRLYEHGTEWSDERALPTDELPEDSPGEGTLAADANGAVTLAFTQWIGATPTRIYVREPDGTFVPLSEDALDADSPPVVTADSRGNRYVVWADAEARLRYANHLISRTNWSDEGIFPTLTGVEQVTIATTEDANHLVWRDPATRQLHHNPRMIQRDEPPDAAEPMDITGDSGGAEDAGWDGDAVEVGDPPDTPAGSPVDGPEENAVDGPVDSAASADPLDDTGRRTREIRGGCGCTTGGAEADPWPRLTLLAIAWLGCRRRRVVGGTEMKD